MDDANGFVIEDGVLEEYTGPGGEVVIPQGVTRMGDHAFEGCSGLSGVVMPQGVKTIGERAFSGCAGLSSVTIPEGVTEIGESAFSGCTGLSSVVIPGSVTAIGEDAFDDGVELVRQGAHAPDYPSGV
ncbi:MAG: leucine-rich repeat domain-containing protein [Candidatus Ventricola sp.]|nr:leucine-rich repeat domain-containing protein [Candidatus Ventricola sp.]